MNKEKIAELEKLTIVGLNIIGKLENGIAEAGKEIEKLKKEDEVKPVFPDYVHNETTYVMVADNYLGGSTAESLGLTADSEEGRLKIYNWLTARKFVIEAVNKANKGDNGFKVGGSAFDNYLFNPLDGHFWSNKTQATEGALYFRNGNHANFAEDGKFIDAYKTMLGY